MATHKILQYPECSMTNALNAVRSGMPVKTAAKTFNVPKTTLLYKFRGINPESRKMGPATIFSSIEEDILVKWIKSMAKSGFPISKEIFLSSASKLAKELNKAFKNNIPGRKWYEGFLRRHPEITLRTPQNLTMSRSSVTQIQIKRWFNEVHEFLKDSNSTNILQDPNRIFNADESAFFLNPKGNKVLALRGDKTVYTTVNSNEKECLTVLLNGNAAGTLAPPMIIFRYKRIPSDLSLSVPREWGIGISENGWMTSDTFYSYMANVFYPWAKKTITFPILFFVDGHSSHLSYHLSKFCSENGIILVALYPNATHLLQPMDVAVFRTLKSGWKEQVSAWRLEHQHEILRRRDFAPLLQAAIQERVTPNILENGFKKCGLFPWNPEVVSNFFSDDNQPSSKESEGILRTNNMRITDHLTFLESFIDQDTLNYFRSQISKESWSGRIEDRSLFIIWKKMQECCLKPNSMQDMIENAEIVFENTTINVELIDIVNSVDTICHEADNILEPLTAESPIIESTPLPLEIITPEPSSEKINCENVAVIDCVDENNISLDEPIRPDTSLYDSFDNDDLNWKPETTILNKSRSTSGENKINIIDVQVITPTKTNFELREQISPIECSNTQENEMNVLLNEPIMKTPNPKSDFSKRKTSVEYREVINTEKEPIVPSPFKRVLFWPESKPLSKKTKEKIPSVVTSQLWQDYNKSKTEKKAKIEAEKLERKRKIEARKKDGKKIKKTPKSSSKNDEFDSDEDNIPLSTLRRKLNPLPRMNLKPQDYVVVSYEGKYFPGKIIDIRDKEYFVSAMAQSGRTGWRWPDISDEIWYSEKEVVMTIKPPKMKNSRGIFLVEEMEEFTEFSGN